MSKYVEVNKIHSDLVYACCHPCDYRNGKLCLGEAYKGICGIVQKLEKKFDIEIVYCLECGIRDTSSCPIYIRCGYTEDNDFCSMGEPKEVTE